MAIKHAFESEVPDGGNASLVQPSDWNDDHDIETATVTPETGDKVLILDVSDSENLKDCLVSALATIITAAIVDSAPGTLDTLNELAAALGDDPAFATTVTNALALKAPLISPSFTTPALGTPASGTLSNCTVDGTNPVGFKNIPQNPQSDNYTAVLADAGKHIYETGASKTVTIPANGSVAYPIGTAITIIPSDAGGCSIDITSDTLIWAEDGSTGSRSLAQYGIATAIKVASTTWIISGPGLS